MVWLFGVALALKHVVVVVDQFPDRAVVQTAVAVGGDIVLLHIVAVVIRCVRNLLLRVVPGCVFRSGQKTIVGVAKEIDALVPCCLRGIAEQANAKLIVLLIAAGLLPLSQIAGPQVVDSILDRAGACSAFV